MSDYKAIDEYVQCYQTGQKSSKGSPERERGKNAAEMLLMTFKPLICPPCSTPPASRPPAMRTPPRAGVWPFWRGS